MTVSNEMAFERDKALRKSLECSFDRSSRAIFQAMNANVKLAKPYMVVESPSGEDAGNLIEHSGFGRYRLASQTSARA